MKRVVMIAYSFPPEGSAGVHRPLRFVRHLPELGWHATVICEDTDTYERYDGKLLASIRKETEVIRVKNLDPWRAIQKRRAVRLEKQMAQTSAAEAKFISEPQSLPFRSLLRNIVRKVEAWCYQPDMSMGWIRPAVEAIVKTCRNKRADVIWATGQPWSSYMVAQRAAKRLGVPYVMDFRGSWTLVPNSSQAGIPEWAKRYQRKILYKLFEATQGAVFFHDTEAESYRHAYKGALDNSKIYVIPNGFDGIIEDFQAPGGDKCTVLYTGTLQWHRYDTLLQALVHLKRFEPALANRLRFDFVGENSDKLASDVNVLGLSDIVKTARPTTQAEITRRSREAHAFLMLGLAPTVIGYETIVGSKLFGYMQAGRPIVGVLPPGEAKKILHRIGVSTVADAESTEEIVGVLKQLLNAWSVRKLSSLVPNRGACEVYSAERQTAALVRVLEGKPAAEPFIPGSVEIPPSLREMVNYHLKLSTGAQKI